MKTPAKNKKIWFGTSAVFLAGLILPWGAVSALAEAAPVSPCPYSWTKNLKVGSSGADVLKLQQFLNASADTAVALSGVGSAGNEGTYFGALSARAVSKFQEKYAAEILAPAGLAKGTGILGAGTRAKLNSLCAAGYSSTVPSFGAANAGNNQAAVSASSSELRETAVPADSLTVSKPDQPAHTIAPANAGWVPFTNITLTAGGKDVTVKDMTVERVGVGADGAFFSVALTDQDQNQIGKARSLNSNHKVVLGEPLVIPANTSNTFTIMGNMQSDLTNYDGQMPTFQIDSINADAAVSGNLPVRGTAQTINTNLVIGTGNTSLSQFDPNSATTRYINDANVRFSGIRISADSKEDLSLSSMGWYQSGSVSPSDLARVATIVGTTTYPTDVKGKLFTSTFNPPIIIKKGQSIDLYVQGDILPGAVNRTVEFDIQTTDDIALLGESYGFYVSIAPENSTAVSGHSVFITSDGSTSGDAGTPFFSGSVVTVSGGAFTSVGKSTGQ